MAAVSVRIRDPKPKRYEDGMPAISPDEESKEREIHFSCADIESQRCFCAGTDRATTEGRIHPERVDFPVRLGERSWVVVDDCVPRSIRTRKRKMHKQLANSQSSQVPEPQPEVLQTNPAYLNALEPLGASTTTGDPLWFLVSPYYANGSVVMHCLNAVLI